MDQSSDCGFVELWEHSVAVPGTPRETPSSELEVNVLFTGYKKTLGALRTAGSLAHQLQARIKLLAPRVVPYRLPITEPPVALAFAQQQLMQLVQQAPGELQVSVHLYLCRDKQACFLGLLKPRSLVVMGNHRRWWRTEESKLAKALQFLGHHVIVAKTP